MGGGGGRGGGGGDGGGGGGRPYSRTRPSAPALRHPGRRPGPQDGEKEVTDILHSLAPLVGAQAREALQAARGLLLLLRKQDAGPAADQRRARPSPSRRWPWGTTAHAARLVLQALVLAKRHEFDVFNALDILDNDSLLKASPPTRAPDTHLSPPLSPPRPLLPGEPRRPRHLCCPAAAAPRPPPPRGRTPPSAAAQELKFGIGDGHLQYYLYNWRCPTVVTKEIRPRPPEAPTACTRRTEKRCGGRSSLSSWMRGPSSACRQRSLQHDLARAMRLRRGVGDTH